MIGLALSGGAARGAWQAGVMAALCRPWEVVAGVSVGAVNAVHLAQYPVGQEADAVADLEALWRKLRTKDVHRRWRPFGMLHGLWKPGVRDLRPLRRTLARLVDPQRVADSGRKLRIGAVDVPTGSWHVWTEADADVIVDAVLASCAIPYAFAPQPVRGVLYQDGGIRTVAPVATLIADGCTEADAIVCFPSRRPVVQDAPGNALDAGLISVDTMSYQIVDDDLRVDDGACGLRVHRPATDLGDGLDFDPATNAWRFQLGKLQGR